ncbi:FAD-dependent pyridine nucleotide-disulphide oxidoreductase [Xylanimonas cellulosilytica DSM 15894]|uniref:FAD-dependent pyridine nucleotide-disulphide oxidoreductase n=1 Tax=Xylanimonas cellulosilytica (strain DSM 15894 / JCM 12276 / CECT 5975 / KCTC 9989 / LMG 20990 / NBRC 107835 / XIL07) TaxID=446471 RepID=D1BTK9_XYLCX|nr:FAD-dependent oxidoreductase [Xylanimonas cellulosilytica]ACZ30988.1 FAD-dependent pyridine nucleotide-disulphide oxidoreductase [Xylanimonas cellulosilytica DSM 15894]
MAAPDPQLENLTAPDGPQPAGAAPRIVIVGGVATGMSAAARARRLDESAEILVLERGEHVSFAGCGLPYHVGGEIASADTLLVHTPATLAASLNLDVRTRHDVVGLDADARTVRVRTPDGERTIAYDALVLAPGARAVRPPLPGIDSPRVRTLRTVPDAVTLRSWVDGAARRAVVLGAGFIGLEAAEQLAAAGLEVAVVERTDHVLPPLEGELAALVTAELDRLGIAVHDGASATAIEPGDGSDVVVLDDGTRLDADLVVLSVGVRPDTAVFAAAGVATDDGAIVVDEHGRTNLPHVWAGGDAVVSTDAVTGVRRPVALAGPANRAGRQIADAILRPATARPIPAAVGTAIVRVGRLAAGMTGANRTALAAAGIAHHTLHLHPAQHAGWFPGATQVHLLLHFDDGGRILGAQAVGADGVDKRLDVLATAIRGGLGVEDLIDLDLAYAPPFGAAKDPVNLAGMAAANVLDGTLRPWHAADLDAVLASSLVLDVRTEAELATGHLPGILHVPHTELRARLDEVRAVAAGRPVAVLCQSGVRSNLAHRILRQAGFEASSLSGGMLTLRATLGRTAATRLVTPATAEVEAA